jgi:hypothetical protein
MFFSIFKHHISVASTHHYSVILNMGSSTMTDNANGSGGLFANEGGLLASPGDLEGESIFEKKCTLINRELDRYGMGRYQWYIWTLCGFGYLIDLLWAQAFGLVLSPLEQELGFPGALRLHHISKLVLTTGEPINLAISVLRFRRD